MLTRLAQAAGSSEPEMVRETLNWKIEELREADAIERPDAGPQERTPDRLASATAIGRARSIPAQARSGSGSPSSVPSGTSRTGWSSPGDRRGQDSRVVLQPKLFARYLHRSGLFRQHSISSTAIQDRIPSSCDPGSTTCGRSGTLLQVECTAPTTATGTGENPLLPGRSRARPQGAVDRVLST